MKCLSAANARFAFHSGVKLNFASFSVNLECFEFKFEETVNNSDMWLLMDLSSFSPVKLMK